MTTPRRPRPRLTHRQRRAIIYYHDDELVPPTAIPERVRGAGLGDVSYGQVGRALTRHYDELRRRARLQRAAEAAGLRRAKPSPA